MLGKIRGISKTVEVMLREYPETRDSDVALMLRVWRFNMSLDDAYLTAKQWEQLEEAMMYANPESIRRTRQKLQEQGKYLGQPKVKQERYIRSLEMEQAMPMHRTKFNPDTNTMEMF